MNSRLMKRHLHKTLLKNLVFSIPWLKGSLPSLISLRVFLGITAHDLRNPIVSIRGFSELILGEPENLTKTDRTAYHYKYSQQPDADAPEHLLDVSIIESGKLDLQLELLLRDFLVDKG